MTGHLSRIRDLFAAATSRVLVVSAYVGQAAVTELLDASTGAAERTVYARWEIDDVASGASDWRVWDIAAERGVPFFACPRLHAKIYIADNTALVGSANATGAGIGLSANANLELLIEVDARHASVMEVIRIAQETSALASPIGPDVVMRQRNNQEQHEKPNMPIWLPRSDPSLFLKTMTGRTPHDDLTHQDRETVGLPSSAECSRHAIREAVRDMTAFRIVRREFETRMIPMGLSDLRALLVSCVSADLSHMKDDDVVLLARWLGQFGANTLTTPSASGRELQLMPGMMLGSDDEFHG